MSTFKCKIKFLEFNFWHKRSREKYDKHQQNVSRYFFKIYDNHCEHSANTINLQRLWKTCCRSN